MADYLQSGIQSEQSRDRAELIAPQAPRESREPSQTHGCMQCERLAVSGIRETTYVCCTVSYKRPSFGAVLSRLSLRIAFEKKGKRDHVGDLKKMADCEVHNASILLPSCIQG